MNKKTKQSIYNLMCSVGSMLVSIVLGMLLPRIILVKYGSEMNGLLNSVTQFISYLIVFEAGILEAATQALYKTVGNKDRPATNEILSAVHKNYQRIGVVYCLGLIGIAALYPLFVPVEELSWFQVFLIMFFSGLSNVVAFFFQAKYKILLTVDGRAYVFSNLTTLVTVLTNVLKIVLLLNGMKIYYVIMLSFLPSLIQTLYVSLYINKKYKWVDLSATPNHAALTQSKDAMVHQISGLIFSSSNTLILTLFCDLKVVSVYAVYTLVVGHLELLMDMPFNSCSFALGQMYNTNRERYKKLLDSMQVLFAAMLFSVFTITYRLLLPFVSLYTDGVTDAAYIDKWLPLLFVILGLLKHVRTPTRHTVKTAGHFRQTLPRSIAETAITVVASIIGVLFLGIHGVLLGTIIAVAWRTLDFIFYANKVILERSPKKDLWIFGANALLAIGIAVVLHCLPLEIASYLDFVKAGLLISPVVILLFATFNWLLFREDIKLALAFFIKKKKG
ncbi:MAG: hypothetical protein IJO76_01840 [Clostridia bacterium]|nr:hypothetical protein [Clostridia bacterium]